MRITEFALRGLRRFEGGRKLAFQEGYNLLSGPNESGKTTCLLALLATLEPEWIEGRGGSLAPEGAPHGQARTGLIFLHEDRTYRLVRDLDDGAASLGVLDPDSGKYQAIGRDAEAVRRWLHESAGLPGRRAFETLFCLDRAGMPSAADRRGLAGGFAGRGAAASGDGLGAVRVAAAPAAPPSGAAKEARIAELKAELARIEEMGQVEFRLDGVKAKLFEIEAEFGDIRKLDQMAAELDRAIAEFEALGVDPDQLEARARGFKALADRREADLAAVEAEREALELAANAPVTPVQKDPLVLAGGGVAVAGLVGGVFLQGLAVLALLGLGTAVYGAVRDIQAAGRRKAAFDALAGLDDRIQAIEKRFEIETKAVRAAQETLAVAGPGGVLERVEQYRALKERRAAVAERREAVTQQKNVAALEAERERLTAEVAALEEQLRGFGATAAFDAGELKRELDVLEGRAAPAPAALDDAVGLGIEGDPFDGGRGGGGPSPLSAALDAWLDAAARILPNSREGIARELLLRVQPMVGPLTANLYRSLAFDGDGRLVAVAADGRARPVADASAGTQDVLYFALRLAGHTMVVRERAFPLLLDDPLGALDDSRLPVACRALKAAARSGQIIHTTVRRRPPALADAVQSLA
ncbi:MAG TPA: hypothetical protein VF406_19155 [Thermodesulfobacteriota bacterium]